MIQHNYIPFILSGGTGMLRTLSNAKKHIRVGYLSCLIYAPVLQIDVITGSSSCIAFTNFDFEYRLGIVPYVT